MKGLTREEYDVLKRVAAPVMFHVDNLDSSPVHNALIAQRRAFKVYTKDKVQVYVTEQGMTALRIYEELLKIGVVLT